MLIERLLDLAKDVYNTLPGGYRASEGQAFLAVLGVALARAPFLAALAPPVAAVEVGAYFGMGVLALLYGNQRKDLKKAVLAAPEAAPAPKETE